MLKRFSVFSVGFQHRISKCISYLFYAVGKHRFVNISGSYYAPKLYLSVCLSQTDSNFLSQTVSQCNFLLLFNVPGALNSLFSSWFTPFYVWALKAAGTQAWQKGELTGSHIFFSSVFTSSLLRFLLFSSKFLFSLSSVYFSPNCPILTCLLSLLVLIPTQSLMFSFFLYPSLALGLSFTDNLPRVASIHLLALKLSTPFLTQKTPKVEMLKEESRMKED